MDEGEEYSSRDVGPDILLLGIGGPGSRVYTIRRLVDPRMMMTESSSEDRGTEDPNAML